MAQRRNGACSSSSTAHSAEQTAQRGTDSTARNSRARHSMDAASRPFPAFAKATCRLLLLMPLVGQLPTLESARHCIIPLHYLRVYGLVDLPVVDALLQRARGDQAVHADVPFLTDTEGTVLRLCSQAGKQAGTHTNTLTHTHEREEQHAGAPSCASS